MAAVVPLGQRPPADYSCIINGNKNGNKNVNIKTDKNVNINIL